MAAFRAMPWVLRDFVAKIRGPILLDSGLGWVVRGHDLLEVGNWSIIAQAPLLNKPSLLRWARAKMTAEDVGRAVWLPFGAGNYWHFFNDMVAGLALLAERHDLTDWTVLVSEELAAKSFFKEVVSLSSLLSALEWRTYRHDRWLRASDLLVAGTSFGSLSTFRRAIALLDQLPPLKATPTRQLFLTRSEEAGRSPENLATLAVALLERGFERVEFEGLTVIEQRELVNSATSVVALHGAGMANLAFHEAPSGVKLLEITPSDHLNPCFAFMVEEMGMDYFCYAGGERDFGQRESFDVPIEDFLDALDNFLAR